MTTDGWPLAAGPATLPAEGEVHVWRIALDVEPGVVDALSRLLSGDERERADRYRFDRHRRRFVVCRGAQRSILGDYLGRPADGLRFAYSARGKPSLPNQRRVAFNVTNSRELAACAVSRGVELGVDIEEIREARDLMGLAARFFAECEIAELEQLDPQSRLAAFYAVWTRKEAILKAAGTGLAFPLNQVAVTSRPGRDCRVMRFGADAESAGQWWLQEFAPGAGYIGAIAARGTPLRICRWHWRPSL